VIIGRHPRIPVIGDTVLSRNDFRRGAGIIVDSEDGRYRVYWRAGEGTLGWHTRRELAIPRLEYERQWA
jgi:hypothetical protein